MTEPTANPARTYFTLPGALLAPNSTTPTATRLEMAAPSRTRSVSSRPGSSRCACTAVAAASIGQTVHHTHAAYTAASTSQPTNGAARGAPQRMVVTVAAVPATKDTRTLTRALDADPGATCGFIAPGCRPWLGPCTAQAGQQRFDNPLRFLGIPDLDRGDTGLLGRVVVPAGEQGIADEHHLLNGHAEDVAELVDSVGLVDAALGDVDRGRATQPHLELGDEFVEDRLHRGPLGEVRVPAHLGLQRSLLSQC